MPVLREHRASSQGRSPVALGVDSTLVADKESSAVELDGGVVVLSMRAGSYFGFNRVASEIWHMLAAPCRVNQIFDALAQQHEVDRATLARDVTPFLKALLEHRLVRLIDSGDGR
jgi:hypothetical protein